MAVGDVSGCDVAIVGGGPAGLSAAIELRRLGVEQVVVIERESAAGGVPRDTNHTGFGIRDLHRAMSGPKYAATLTKRAETAGVEIRTSTTVVDWIARTSLRLADPSGMAELDARAVVLATGVRERPRAARLIPGDRGAGIYTTGSLQRLTARYAQAPGRRAVVVGAEHVSFSAILTLAHAGCSTAALVTALPRHQSYWPLRIATATLRRIPIVHGESIAEIRGRHRVESVVLTNGRTIACDTVVFTGDWMPDHELARRGSIEIDESHRGPLIDVSGRTNRAGVFAVGNLVHPAETADVCAIDGHRVGSAIVEWLTSGEWPDPTCRIGVSPPITWISPSIIGGTTAVGRVHLFLRVGEVVETRSIVAAQAGNVLWHGNVVGRRLVPNRSIHIPAEWLGHIDPQGGDIVVTVHD